MFYDNIITKELYDGSVTVHYNDDDIEIIDLKEETWKYIELYSIIQNIKLEVASQNKKVINDLYKTFGTRNLLSSIQKFPTVLNEEWVEHEKWIQQRKGSFS